MVILRFAVVGIMAQATMAGTIAVRREHTCATRDPSPEEQGLWKRQQNEVDNGRSIELGAAFHFCCVSETDCPSDGIAKNEINVMNEFYAPAQINFKLQNTSRIIDASCGQTDVTDQATMDNLKMKSHQGDVGTLNIVYVPTNEGPGAKGYCVIPPPSDNIGQIFGRKDGCVVATSTLPGQSRFGGDDKDVTSVHEAGHWLGLQHWNEGNGGPGFNRRQTGGTRNIMVPFQITGQGIKYQFDQSQIPIRFPKGMMARNPALGVPPISRGVRDFHKVLRALEMGKILQALATRGILLALAISKVALHRDSLKTLKTSTARGF
ncbi:hypothetical protein HRG_000632 [Hirsutella rhossiliensis]|uniref:Peptidase M43 pregnancy-associated plasma-A domain-containing protein n=1 Tax=Hirsutella rhossiliensis TaxID=111463 RepID=A0A9P8N703_9HYPO|nr:uncharacterized protein HRG_00632 [Hirsutella rhossiliensis]KAH0967990.1 hypothetical protein HRG_00632 [Hirsutella rhossiliensis]